MSHEVSTVGLAVSQEQTSSRIHEFEGMGAVEALSGLVVTHLERGARRAAAVVERSLVPSSGNPTVLHAFSALGRPCIISRLMVHAVTRCRRRRSVSRPTRTTCCLLPRCCILAGVEAAALVCSADGARSECGNHVPSNHLRVPAPFSPAPHRTAPRVGIRGQREHQCPLTRRFSRRSAGEGSFSILPSEKSIYLYPSIHLSTYLFINI